MMQWRVWLFAGILVVGSISGTAEAVIDVDVLLDALVKHGTLSADQAGTIRQQITENQESYYKDLGNAIVAAPARNIAWKGDIRLRDEIRNREISGSGEAVDAHRQRIRFRYGFEANVSDHMKVNARLATGTSSTGGNGLTGDPVGTNQSFDTNFIKKNISLDLANLEYMPEIPGVDHVKVTGGIMPNPLWGPGPLVWDGDLSMDGAALQMAHQVMEGTKLFYNGGVFVLDTGETQTPALWVSQGGVEWSPFPDADAEALKHFKLIGAIAYHDYQNVVAAGTDAGNDLIARETQNSALATDFNQINPTVEVRTSLAGVPVGTWFDWVHNTRAPVDNDGFQIGLKAGKASKPLAVDDLVGWAREGIEGGYYFQQLERDAAFDEFVDSDFLDGGTSSRGHVFYVTVATLKHSTAGVKYYVAREHDKAARDGKDHEDRIQLDWVTKF